MFKNEKNPKSTHLRRRIFEIKPGHRTSFSNRQFAERHSRVMDFFYTSEMVEIENMINSTKLSAVKAEGERL